MTIFLRLLFWEATEDINAPETGLLRVKDNRQFDELAGSGPMEKRTCVIAGPEYEIGRHFDDVHLAARGIGLPAPLIKSAVPLGHQEVLVRSLMVEALIAKCLLRNAAERSPIPVCR
jgi:hypothetical protein